jgi:clan AA aspartic protease (TIGR02281 family)
MLEQSFRAGRISRASYEGERARVLGYPDPNQAINQSPNTAQERPLAGNRAVEEIALQAKGKSFYLPVRINGTITIPFLLDTGAEGLALPADVASTLVRAGVLQERDMLGKGVGVLADGSEQPMPRVLLREIQVGKQSVRDVPAMVNPSAGGPLLGQAFLSRFGSVTIDYRRNTLVLNR